MRLEALISAVEVQAASRPIAGQVTTVTADSRKTGPGVLFVAVPGTTVDGHRFVDEVIAKGAVGAVVSDLAALEGPGLRILVTDSRTALARLALRIRGNPEQRLQLVGITGTNGKSTTAHLTAQILEAATGKPVGLLGTLGGRVGTKPLPHSLTTPDAVTLSGLFATMLEEGAEAAVMEVSSHAIALRRVEGVSYATAVFTNVSANEHLDFHGTFEEYRATKARLFSEHLRPDGTAVINTDDPSAGLFVQASAPRRVLTFGQKGGGEGHLQAVQVEPSLKGNRFVLRAEGAEQAVELPVPGVVNVYNWLAAAGTALSLGVPLQQVLEATPRLQAVRGRLEPVLGPQPFDVFVDFAHTPAALEQLLDFLRRHATGRVIALFGAGGDRDRTKRPLMGRVAAQYAHHVVLTSDNPRSEDPEKILDEIAEGLAGTPHHREVDRRKAIRHALGLARPGDVVVLAGKGHETTQEIAGTLSDFDDSAVAREGLRELGFER